MVIWSAHDAPAQRSMIARSTPIESTDVLSDAKSWGFGHGTRQPRPPFAATMLPRR